MPKGYIWAIWFERKSKKGRAMGEMVMERREDRERKREDREEKEERIMSRCA